jgi:N-methylhydantoinase A
VFGDEPAPNTEHRTPNTKSLNAAFHVRHAALYGRSDPDRPTEIVQARLQAVGATAKPALPRLQEVGGPPAKPMAVRRIWFQGWEETPVFSRSDFQPGQRVAGPALLVQADTTTLVAPGWQGAVDAWGNLVLCAC